jgi:hypothetical protein
MRQPFKLSCHVCRCHKRCTHVCIRSSRRPASCLACLSEERVAYCFKYSNSAACACLQNKPLAVVVSRAGEQDHSGCRRALWLILAARFVDLINFSIFQTAALLQGTVSEMLGVC